MGGVLRIAVAAAIGMSFGTLVVPSAGAQSDATQWQVDDIRAARTLIAHVPDDIRPSCTMHNLRAPGGDSTLVAAISCDVPGGEGGYTLSYSQYDSIAHMQASYDDVVAAPLDVERPTGCEEDNGYSVDDEPVGSYACVPDTYSNSVVYTYEPLRVVASLTDYFDDGIDSDVASLVTYWNDSAGPNAAPGSVPKLLTNKQGLAAYQALRARIPAAIRPKCEPNRNSFENLYVAAEIECEHPSPGVWKVRYTSYQDEAGFAAAYDEDGFLALRQDETNTPCPESGTWRAKGATRGRYACTVDRDNSYLLWTLDRDRIVAYAYAQVGDMDTADFIEWWNDVAGPRL